MIDFDTLPAAAAAIPSSHFAWGGDDSDLSEIIAYLFEHDQLGPLARAADRMDDEGPERVTDDAVAHALPD